MQAMIEIEGLTKDYQADFWKRKVRALDGFSVRIERGDLFAFLGLNGSGKTTLLEKTIEALKNDINIGVLEGDIETDLDADYKKLQIRLLAIEIIRKLDKNSRMLLEMVYLKNKTMAKIADKMDFKNEQSAKTQKFKALTKLRDLIKENSLYKKLIND